MHGQEKGRGGAAKRSYRGSSEVPALCHRKGSSSAREKAVAALEKRAVAGAREKAVAVPECRRQRPPVTMRYWRA